MSQTEQSFYSVYSHESVLDYALSHPHQHLISNNGIEQQQQKVIKIAKSNINLDDGMIEIQNSSIQNDKKSSYETVTQMGNKIIRVNENVIKCQKIIQQIQPSQISIIQNKQQKFDNSMELIKQIDCLSIDQVTEQEVMEIKKKIQMLRQEQVNLQNSLLLANKMLQSSKISNTILQQQIQKYRQAQQAKSPRKNFTKLKQIKQNGTAQEKRFFPQFSAHDANTSLNLLKLVYRQCSLNQSYCIYQNQGYKIQVNYNKEKCTSKQKILIINIKLTPHHHIASKQQFKFGIQIQSEDKLNKNELSYQGSNKFIKFQSWPQGKFNSQIYISQIDEINNKHHIHSILVPLPISHFFQPRMTLLSEEWTKSIKKAASQYTVSITGAVSMNSIEKIKQKWWYGRWLSCIGWSELALFQIYSEQENNNLRVEVFGKKNGKIITGIIEFLSFLLTG